MPGPSARLVSPDEMLARTREEKAQRPFFVRNFDDPLFEGYHKLVMSIEAQDMDGALQEQSMLKGLLSASEDRRFAQVGDHDDTLEAR